MQEVLYVIFSEVQAATTIQVILPAHRTIAAPAVQVAAVLVLREAVEEVHPSVSFKEPSRPFLPRAEGLNLTFIILNL